VSLDIKLKIKYRVEKATINENGVFLILKKLEGYSDHLMFKNRLTPKLMG
jgi:hypothetical protein